MFSLSLNSVGVAYSNNNVALPAASSSSNMDFVHDPIEYTIAVSKLIVQSQLMYHVSLSFILRHWYPKGISGNAEVLARLSPIIKDF